MSSGASRMVVAEVTPAAPSRPRLAADPERSSPWAAASSKALVSSSRWSYHHCASSASLENFGILNLSAISSHPFVGEIKIDQFFGSGKGRDDAQACLPERSDDHEKPPRVSPPDAADAFFALHGLGLDVERAVFIDLLGLFVKNLMPPYKIALGHAPVTLYTELQT